MKSQRDFDCTIVGGVERGSRDNFMFVSLPSLSSSWPFLYQIVNNKICVKIFSTSTSQRVPVNCRV